MNRLFKVDQESVNRCYDFAKQLYDQRAASEKQFGRSFNRIENDYIADHVRGKVVEFAYKSFFEKNYGFSFEVDLNIYPDQLQTDDSNDLATIILDGNDLHNNTKVDIKGVSEKGQWLLIEKYKFIADIYLVGRVNSISDSKNFEKDPFSYKNNAWIVEVIGFASRKAIVDSYDRPYFSFTQGSKLYSKWIYKDLEKKYREGNNAEYFSKVLEESIAKKKIAHPDWNVFIGAELYNALNYGMPLLWLRNTDTDWERFVQYIKGRVVVKE